MDMCTRFIASIMIIAVGTFAVLATGCATGPVRPTYVPATKYQGLDCNALRSEYARIDTYIRQGVEPPKRVFSGVGIGLGAFGGGGFGWGFSPSVTFNAGQSSSSERTVYARLLGERDAVAQQAQFKGCPIVLTSPSQS